MKVLTDSLELIQPGLKAAGLSKTETSQDVGFGDALKNAIQEVNALQNQSAEMKTKLVTGEIQDIHQVMIASEKANLAFQLTLQIRNKVVEAYQEIMRMQV